ncbi:lysophospholipid acyltransferase family protein [Actinoplanes sp. NBRC 103695]|uniref:lysophospholipid acyltransferase family protein n=1 Tax=Actinoplanes sp. NBRC 103695 TaxID=3032202 RepID=UPI0024A49186|nr:lysophospholipid acyltransferase family protein [Actinoplanes sp. NBRC 103695]GLY94570.1 1-acyl-sn-glycerol-3-phosphate acyltransferase [Actinoplanes sp. NBRC 103695]
MAIPRLGFWRRLAVAIVLPVLKVWTSKTWRGADNLPAGGGVILVANHASHFDPLVISYFLYDNGRWPRFLAKASLWKVPLFGPFLKKVKQIPVERGSVEAVKSLDALVDALNDGGTVVIYPEGTTSKEPDLWPMRGKTGAARLALKTGAPIIPLANWGAYQIYDSRTKKIGLKPRRPVAAIAGPPIDLGRWQGQEPTRQVLEEITEHIMLTIRDQLGEIREGTPPPLYQPTGRAKTPPEVTG